MRIKIGLDGTEKIVLPVGFNKYLQALIYTHLDKTDANWLHEQGFIFKKRHFRLFVFSSILEKGVFDKETKTFTFPQKISFYLASPVDWIIEQVATNLIKTKEVNLGPYKLQVLSIGVIKPEKITTDNIKIKAITPIEVHSTFTKPDGKKITHYYTPYEKEFSELINENLKKKWEVFYKHPCPFELSITPLFEGNRNERIVYFGTGKNKTIIKGWKGYFDLKGAPPLLQFALDVGLGNRNSQGFGMIEVIKTITSVP